MEDQRLVDRLRNIRLGGRVERCHAVPHHGSYSNAAHSWGVAMVLWVLWPEHFPRLGIYCLAHDIPEFIVGDIPAPTLRFNPEMREMIQPLESLVAAGLQVPSEHDLSEEDMAILKVCDRLELYFWANEQMLMGNQWAEPLRLELEYYLEKVGMPMKAATLYEQLKSAPFPVWRRGGEWMEKMTQETS